MKIRQEGAELFLSDGLTDGPDEANFCFPPFCERA